MSRCAAEILVRLREEGRRVLGAATRSGQVVGAREASPYTASILPNVYSMDPAGKSNIRASGGPSILRETEIDEVPAAEICGMTAAS